MKASWTMLGCVVAVLSLLAGLAAGSRMAKDEATSVHPAAAEMRNDESTGARPAAGRMLDPRYHWLYRSEIAPEFGPFGGDPKNVPKSGEAGGGEIWKPY
jgi:hypothetical protein